VKDGRTGKEGRGGGEESEGKTRDGRGREKRKGGRDSEWLGRKEEGDERGGGGERGLSFQLFFSAARPRLADLTWFLDFF
jgi:hypothetical protein